MDGRLVMETWMDGQMYGRQMDSNLRFCLTRRVLRRFVQLPVPRLQAHLGVWDALQRQPAKPSLIHTLNPSVHLRFVPQTQLTELQPVRDQLCNYVNLAGSARHSAIALSTHSTGGQ